MAARRLTPNDMIVGAILMALLFSITTACLAVQQPWMGLRLTPSQDGVLVAASQGPSRDVPVGARLTAIAGGGDRMALIARDLLIEPDGNLPRFADYDIFLARQDRLARIKASDSIELFGDKGQSWTIAPRGSRPLTDLPVEFWVQQFVGVVAWLISASIWSFRRSQRSARYLLLSGFSTLMFSPFASVYGTRELAIGEPVFRLFSDLNFLGGTLFVASLFALLLYYPRRIAPAWCGVAVVGSSVAWFVAQQVGVFDNMVTARRLLVFIELIGTFVLAGVHWRLTRADPIARAALQWFLLSWLVGCSVFSALIFIPQVFGVDTSALQAFGFLLFVPVYVGLAFGIIRYRLFDMGEWWAGVLAWTISLITLVLLDMGFLFGLHLSSGVSLGLTLLICGLFWLPLRGWLWSRFADVRGPDASGRFRQLTQAAFQTGQAERAEAWRRLMGAAFEPLESRFTDTADPIGIHEDGLSLTVPPAGDLPGMVLRHPRQGRRLFKRADADLAGELAEMFDHLVRNRAAFDAGGAAERRRIAHDIHDNIGATLLGALHTSDHERKDRLIRESLSDLRGIINGVSQPEMGLQEALIPIRRETADRLEIHGIDLEWTTSGQDVVLSSGQVHALHSILREAISNAVRHADCRTVTIRVDVAGDRVAIAIADDGVGFDGEIVRAGNGLASIRERVTSLRGSVEWLPACPDGAGTRLELAFAI